MIESKYSMETITPYLRELWQVPDGLVGRLRMRLAWDGSELEEVYSRIAALEWPPGDSTVKEPVALLLGLRNVIDANVDHLSPEGQDRYLGLVRQICAEIARVLE